MHLACRLVAGSMHFFSFFLGCVGFLKICEDFLQFADSLYVSGLGVPYRTFLSLIALSIQEIMG